MEMPDGQQSLDFAGAAASRADRRNQLLLAVDRIDGGKDLHLMVFAERVWECSERGEPLVASYTKLAGPRMLRCSREKARTTARLAERSGLVRSEAQYEGTQLVSTAYFLVTAALSATDTPVRHRHTCPPQTHLSATDTPCAPLPSAGGETPRAGAGALLDPRSNSNAPPSSIDRSCVRFGGDDGDLREKAHEIDKRLWPDESEGCRRQRKPRDRRLVFQAATLMLSEEFGETAGEAVFHVEISRPKNPAAMLTKGLADYCGAGILARVRVAVRFMRSCARKVEDGGSAVNPEEASQ
jgi:hypothetical protein